MHRHRRSACVLFRGRRHRRRRASQRSARAAVDAVLRPVRTRARARHWRDGHPRSPARRRGGGASRSSGRRCSRHAGDAVHADRVHAGGDRSAVPAVEARRDDVRRLRRARARDRGDRLVQRDRVSRRRSHARARRPHRARRDGRPHRPSGRRRRPRRDRRRRGDRHRRRAGCRPIHRSRCCSTCRLAIRWSSRRSPRSCCRSARSRRGDRRVAQSSVDPVVALRSE